MITDFNIINGRTGNIIDDDRTKAIIIDMIEIQKKRRHERELFYQHTAFILELNIIASNSARPAWPGCTYSTHAEFNVIRHIPHNFSKRAKSLTIFVISTTASGELRISKPCALCLKQCAAIKKKRWNVTTIYYSYDKENVVKDSYSNLMNSCDKYHCKLQRAGGIRRY